MQGQTRNEKKNEKYDLPSRFRSFVANLTVHPLGQDDGIPLFSRITDGLFFNLTNSWDSNSILPMRYISKPFKLDFFHIDTGAKIMKMVHTKQF